MTFPQEAGEKPAAQDRKGGSQKEVIKKSDKTPDIFRGHFLICFRGKFGECSDWNK